MGFEMLVCVLCVLYVSVLNIVIGIFNIRIICFIVLGYIRKRLKFFLVWREL